jgi:hypothetical protein
MFNNDPNPSFANGRYRKCCLPNYFEYIDHLAGDLFTCIGQRRTICGELLQNLRLDWVQFEQFEPFCSASLKLARRAA